MHFQELPLAGCYLIDPEPAEDDRGFFARAYCEQEFAEFGLTTRWVQCNISYNHLAGTLRGMHYQAAPDEEVKLVRCTRGALHDVVVDMRPDSGTYLAWHAVELSADNHRMLYIPKGLAHGFYTLEDQTEVFYQMSSFYAPGSARGYRWNDPAFGISWPGPVAVISDRDQQYPDFSGQHSHPVPA